MTDSETLTDSRCKTGILNANNNYLLASLKVQDERKPDSFLYKLRKQHKLTQEELGALAGVSKWHISKMETGGRPITLEVAWKLGRFFEVDPELLCNDPKICIAR